MITQQFDTADQLRTLDRAKETPDAVQQTYTGWDLPSLHP
jgi:hypothetical protein